ncbi:hypothetical protein [Paenibacillus sp. NPDC058071]|uniref:hypothetical protein n=1 Tax=Paenibacillus sp. NPDC058071 TaxID=3346326 RepID=UPI0036D7E917
MIHKFTMINVGSLTKEILNTQLLILRLQGARVRKELSSVIANAADAVVALDFKDVTGIDFSCSDEIVVHFQEYPSERNGKGIVLLNLSENHFENISIALDRKKQAIWCFNGSHWTILGSKLPRYLMELALVMKDRREITARQLADDLKEDINSQSTKLKKLYDHGLVLRTEDRNSEGSQFIYKSLF